MRESIAPKALIKNYPEIMNINEMCCLLQISTKTGYKLLRDNQIESMKVGRSYRIAKVHVLKYMKMIGKDSSRKA